MKTKGRGETDPGTSYRMASLRRMMKAEPEFFVGTKLPILMKTKGRGEIDPGTKLPYGLAEADDESEARIFCWNKATDLDENKRSG
jgi:hypothetical protein